MISGVELVINSNYRLLSPSAARQQLKAALRRWLVGMAIPLANEQADELRQEPGRPRYPLAWASEKQRRYVMAKLRREGNLSYRRTHALARGWEATGMVGDASGSISVTNPASMAGYVYAPYQQQPFHAVTGWMDVQQPFARISTVLADRLIEDWPAMVRGSVMK